MPVLFTSVPSQVVGGSSGAAGAQTPEGWRRALRRRLSAAAIQLHAAAAHLARNSDREKTAETGVSKNEGQVVLGEFSVSALLTSLTPSTRVERPLLVQCDAFLLK